MSRLDSFQPHAGTRVEFSNSKRTAPAQHSPEQNRLLAALPEEDYERLLPDLKSVPLLPGCTVHAAGDREKYLYFITAGIVSRLYVMENGASAHFAVTGSDGVIGIASFLGGESTPSQAVVLSAGYAYRLPMNVMKNEFKRDGPLAHLLLRYAQALLCQIAQIAVCNRHHSVEQQLCCWILSTLDCLPSNELTMTHELIANMLGVRREGVTEAARRLQQARLIQYGRGHIVALDRSRLEARACECYAVVKREHDRLLPPANTICSAGVHHTEADLVSVPV